MFPGEPQPRLNTTRVFLRSSTNGRQMGRKEGRRHPHFPHLPTPISLPGRLGARRTRGWVYVCGYMCWRFKNCYLFHVTNVRMVWVYGWCVGILRNLSSFFMLRISRYVIKCIPGTAQSHRQREANRMNRNAFV